jgi:hypothetical protein
MTFPSSSCDKPNIAPKRPPPPSVHFEDSIDDWQTKINDDFNQLYLSLYKNPRDFGMTSTLANVNPEGVVVNETISQNPNPRRQLTVPEIIVTNTKDTRTIEKFDTIERREHIFEDPTENILERSFLDLGIKILLRKSCMK